MRPLAIVEDYTDLIIALRARQNELGISYEALSEIAGLPDRYAAKLLSLSDTGRSGARRLGTRSLTLRMLGPVLGSLGLKILLVPNEEALARLRSRYEARDEAHTTSARARWERQPGAPTRRSARARNVPVAGASVTEPPIPNKYQGRDEQHGNNFLGV